MVKLCSSYSRKRLKVMIQSVRNTASLGFGFLTGRRKKTGLIQRKRVTWIACKEVSFSFLKPSSFELRVEHRLCPSLIFASCHAPRGFFEARAPLLPLAEILASPFRFSLACFSSALGSRAISYWFLSQLFLSPFVVDFVEDGADHSTGQASALSNNLGKVVPQPL